MIIRRMRKTSALHTAARALVLGAMSAMCASTASQAAIIYVDDTAVGANNGTSWADAYTKLRPVLNMAQPGDEVRIAQGVYSPANPGGSRELSFVLPAGASVVGGFAGDGAIDPDAFDPQTYITILTGDIDGDDGPDFANTAENSLHVVTADGGDRSTILRGVDIVAGNANGSADPFTFDSVGGGVLVIDGASPSILDCVLELNQAAYQAGALYAAKASPLVRRCTLRNNRTTLDESVAGAAMLGTGSLVQCCNFEDNSAGVAGGATGGSGIKFTDTTFTGNVAVGAGGAVTGNMLTFTECTFMDNYANIGGAMRCSDSTIKNTVFDTNTASNRGGAIVNGLTGSLLTVDSCTFTLNSAKVGGAIDTRSAINAYNCLFDRNSTGVLGYNGGAIAVLGTGDIVNCAFIGNSAVLGGGAISLNNAVATVTNCQFSGNTSEVVGSAIVNDDGTLTLDNCTIVGNTSQLLVGSPGSAVRNRDGGVLIINNSLLWNNNSAGDLSQESQVFRETGTLELANSTLQGWTGSYGGANNNGDDPLFVDADGGDDTFGTDDDNLQLQAASPARNTGDNSLVSRDALDINNNGNTNQRVPYDLAGNRRIRQSIVDRGTFEFDPHGP